MNIVVTVLGPPTLVDPDCLPVIRQVWEHEVTGFRCAYNNNPKEMVIVVAFQS